MGLKTSEVYRCLDKKTLILGFEILDLFFVFTLLAVLNFFLGGVQFKALWTWGPTIAFSIGLRISKAGKPDNYLAHLMKFQFLPGEFSCFYLAQSRPKFIHRKGVRI